MSASNGTTTHEPQTPAQGDGERKTLQRKRSADEITPATAAHYTIEVTRTPPSPPEEDKREARGFGAIELVPDEDKADLKNFYYECFNHNYKTVTPEYAREMAKLLPRKPIRELRFQCLGITDETFSIIAEGLKGHRWLERLVVGWSEIGDAGARAAAAVVASEGSRLRELGMRSTQIGDAGAAALAEALEDPQCPLQLLNLKGHRIGSKGFYAIGHALTANASLTSLDLSEVVFGGVGMGVAAGSLCHIGARDFAADVRKNRTLQYLNLADTNLRGGQGAELCRGLAGHPSLEELDLSRNDMAFTTENNMDALLSLIAANEGALLVLGVSYCNLGAYFWDRLAKAMETNRTLGLLKLKVGIDSEGEEDADEDVSMAAKVAVVAQIYRDREASGSETEIEVALLPKNLDV